MTKQLKEDIRINGVIPGAGACVAKDCPAEIEVGELLCQQHYYDLPDDLKLELHDLVERWNDGDLALASLRDVQVSCVEALRRAKKPRKQLDQPTIRGWAQQLNVGSTTVGQAWELSNDKPGEDLDQFVAFIHKYANLLIAYLARQEDWHNNG